MLHLADRLPPPQADALGIALGQRPGEVPDRFHDLQVACDTYLDAFVAASTVGASSAGDT